MEDLLPISPSVRRVPHPSLHKGAMYCSDPFPTRGDIVATPLPTRGDKQRSNEEAGRKGSGRGKDIEGEQILDALDEA